MVELSELISIVNKNKIAKIEVMGNPSNYAGKMRRLYDGISSGEFQTDKDAIKAIYGELEDLTRYKRLKYRLEQRLLNTVFFIDVNKPSFNDRQKAFYNSYRISAAIRIIEGRGGAKSAARIAERTLSKVLEYEYTEIAVGLLQVVAGYYGSKDLNLKKFKHYSTILNKQIKVLEAEAKAKEYDNIIRIKYFKRIESNDAIHKEAKQFVQELREYLKITQSYRFILPAYNVFMNEHLLINDHKKAIEVCEEGLANTNSKENPLKAAQFFFYINLITLYSKVRQYDKAEATIEESLRLQITSKNTNTSFGLYSAYMRVCFHKRDYQKAYTVYHETTYDQDLRAIKKGHQEQFKLYEAFLHFFIATEKIDPTKSEYPPLKKFRLSKFLNDVPSFTQDKRKHNISLIIIQVLFLLQQKKYGVVIDKVEALKMYCSRYLKKDDTFRSNCFIKLLMTIPKGNFNRIAVERKSEKLLAKLKSVPLEVANQAEDLEFIPYDDLWEIALDMLGTPSRKVLT